MDPLSVTAAVAGLLMAAHEAVKLLGPYVSASREIPPIAAQVREEAESTRTVLVGLQSLFSGRVSRMGALVGVDQVVVILTGGVLLFAELEGAVRGLVAAPTSPLGEGESGVRGLLSTQYRLPLRARLQWARREESLGPLLARLHGFKVSVTVVLILLQCDSDRRAEQLQTELASNIGALLDSNRDLSRRMMHVEDAFDVQTIRSRRRRGIVSAVPATRAVVESGVVAATSASEIRKMSTSAAGSLSASPPSETAVLASDSVFRLAFEFESDLEASRVYRRAQRDTMDFSFRSSVAHTHAWSLLSGRSLPDVSVLSVITLPLDLEGVVNRHHYIDSNDQQLAPMAEEESSAPKPEPSLMEEKLIFHSCFRIYSQLVQIPGFQELFDTQWRAQWLDVAGQWDDDGEWLWQQADVFRALKSIFQKDVTYQLLADNLCRNLDKEVRSDSSHYSRKAAKEPISLFHMLCIEFGFRTDDIFHVNSALYGDNVSFLKVLACVSKVLDRLAGDGTICLMGEDDLEALVSSVRVSSVLPDSAYKHALATFVDAQQSFVRDLLCLISALEKLAPLLGEEHPHISPHFFSSYANFEIELLLTVERMLLAPPRRHLWAVAIHRWSITVETYCALTIVEEQKVKQALRVVIEEQRGAHATPWHNDQTIQENLKLVMSCLELLSRPSQMFPQTTQFFQDILAMLLEDPAGIEMISPVQREDIAEGQRLVKHTLSVVDERFKQRELDEALKHLVLRVEDRANTRIEEFSRLIQVSDLSITVYNNRAEKFHVYLFEKVLLCLVEPKPVAGIRRESLGLAWTIEAVDIASKSSKLELKGKIYLSSIRDINCLSQHGFYKI
ncbi:hypothetical protein GGR58DRAFT_467305 [Xylaria digitata]|nr:hypothetical protein GGR58DRAFT_467305 [Xylaria digitata]